MVKTLITHEYLSAISSNLNLYLYINLFTIKVETGKCANSRRQTDRLYSCRMANNTKSAVVNSKQSTSPKQALQLSYNRAELRSVVFSRMWWICGDRPLVFPCLLCYFSIVSSDFVDLHICICMSVSLYQLLIVPLCCAAAAEPRSLPRHCRASPVYWPCWPVSPVYYRMTRRHVIDLLFWKRSLELFSVMSDFVEWRLTVLWVLEKPRTRSLCNVCCLTNDTLTTSSSSTDC